ncbi:MAG: MFS transporter [Planctomycetes bacterium]|nr:MFS transporter [Planctomycetota bacterium]
MDTQPGGGASRGSFLARRGIGKDVAVLALARFFETVAAGVVVPILPLFLVGLSPGPFAGLPEETLTGIVFFAFGVAMTAGQYVFGRLADRAGRYKPGLLVGIGSFALLSLTYVRIESYVSLLGVRFLQGAALGLSISCIWAILVERSSETKRGASMGFYTSVQMLGLAAGPLLGGWVTELWGERAAFLAAAGLGGLTGLLMALLVRDVQASPARDRVVAENGTPASVFLYLATAVFTQVFAVTMIIAYFPYYAREFGARPGELAVVFSVLVLARFLFQYPFGVLSDRFGRKPFLVGGLVSMLPIMAGLAFAGSVRSLVLFRALQGAATAAVVASAYALAGDRSDPGRRASQLGIVGMGFTAGVTAGPLFAGLLVRLGRPVPFLLAAAAAAAVAVLVGVAVGESRGASVAVLPPSDTRVVQSTLRE